MYEINPPETEKTTSSSTEPTAPLAEEAGTEKKGKKGRKKTDKRRLRAWLLAIAIAVGSFGGGMLTRQLLLDPEMRSLIRLKNRVRRSYYEEITDEEFYNVLFDAVSDNLLDDYSYYLSADEYAQTKSEAKGEQSGIGIVFSTQTAAGEPQMLVSRVCGNSPAEETGVQAGDYLVGYGKTAQEIVKNNVFDDFSEFLAGFAAGESFFVEFEKGGVIEIAKAAYVENYVFYRTHDSAYRFTGDHADVLTQKGEPIPALGADAAYLRLTHFNGAAATEFEKAMELFKTQGKKKLVLDLRGNGGGYLDIMRKIASYFCKGAEAKEPIAAIADYGEKKEIFRASGNRYGEYFGSDSRICVLADSGTASASECLIGCMVDYGAITYQDICLSKRGGVAKTYGKGIMQTTYPLSGIGGDAVKLTTAKICWPLSENCIHGIGVLPENGAKTVEENHEGDQEILAAIEALGL